MSGAILQRIIRANQAAAPRFQSWIQALDRGGGNVYSSVNVFRSVAGGRTKANIDRIRGVHMEIDHDGDAAVQRLFYERACQEQTSTSAAGQGYFHGQLAPSPSGVASVPKLPQLFSLRAPRGRCGSFGESWLLQLQILAVGSLT